MDHYIALAYFTARLLAFGGGGGAWFGIGGRCIARCLRWGCWCWLVEAVAVGASIGGSEERFVFWAYAGQVVGSLGLWGHGLFSALYLRGLIIRSCFRGGSGSSSFRWWHRSF